MESFRTSSRSLKGEGILILLYFWVRPSCVVISPKVQVREPSWYSSVGRASAWSHPASSGMIGPGFEPHQFLLTGMGKRWLSCHAGHQKNSRCHTKGKSQGICNIHQVQKRLPTLALKPRGDVTRSPKQGVS